MSGPGFSKAACVAEGELHHKLHIIIHLVRAGARNEKNGEVLFTS